MAIIDGKPDMVNQPPHYKVGTVETIDMMESIWGREKLAVYCEITAFKYRMRAGHKINASEDIKKAIWYEDKAAKLRGPDIPF